VTSVTAELSPPGSTNTANITWSNPNANTSWDYVRVEVKCNSPCSPPPFAEDVAHGSGSSVTINNLTPGETCIFTVTVISNNVPSTPENSTELTMGMSFIYFIYHTCSSYCTIILYVNIELFILSNNTL